MISKCVCGSKGQDKLHGKKMRVFNKTAKGSTSEYATFRCTVCKSEKSLKI